MSRGARIRFKGRGIQQVLVPINVLDQHWVTGIINMRQGWIQILNSLGERRDKQEKVLREWLALDSPDI